ncbi:MAG: hypothetical protein V4659_09540 [Pseudomonadota bacterium]
MATFSQRVTDLATRIATECKALRTLINGNAADLSALTTTAKGNLVAAMNELRGNITTLIDDAATASTSKTHSITKIRALIDAAVAALIASSPTALDTLNELAAALGNDANFAATINTALGNRVRTDTAAQGLTSQQKANARANIDAYGSVELGDPDTNYVTLFNAALV